MPTAERIALVGVGKIARDQHLPAIRGNDGFELAATAGPDSHIAGVDAHADLDTLLVARPDITCVAICTPPQVRHDIARRALLADRHVLLEKPPGATVAEVHQLIELARSRRLALYATWHSRHADGVEAARAWLVDKTIRSVSVAWKEDVRRWHPGQEWIWSPGGLGVFDPGINALSLLSSLFPGGLRIQAADLQFPANRATPIAATLHFDVLASGMPGVAEFDWRQTGEQTWSIRVAAQEGEMALLRGGACLVVDGETRIDGSDHEYAAIYRRFGELVAQREIDVDPAPLVLVADAFLLGRRFIVDAFD